MQKPHFIFTKKSDSFSVLVKNLEELNVEQIQEIEHFVDLRHGYFDFNTYTFTIRKNLEYKEFTKLINTLHIDAVTQETAHNVQNNNARVNFGQYKGMLYSELPDSYLLWLKSNYMGRDRDAICKEVAKRSI